MVFDLLSIAYLIIFVSLVLFYFLLLLLSYYTRAMMLNATEPR
jgi:hypothetical protein